MLAPRIISKAGQVVFMRKKIEQPYRYSAQFIGRSATTSGVAIESHLLNIGRLD